MLCCSGVQYSSYSGVIENVVRSYVNIKRINVPDMGDEDIGQEIRMKCWIALHSTTFDPDRHPSPYSYLNKTIHNYLYNLRRGTIVPNNGPCNRCEYWNKQNKLCTLDDTLCNKYKQYKKNMQTKLALKNPIGFDKQYVENTVTYADVYDNHNIYELDEYVLHSLPSHLKNYYKLLRSGIEIDQTIKDEIEAIVKDILYQE